jgi:hypothetical protein
VDGARVELVPGEGLRSDHVELVEN